MQKKKPELFTRRRDHQPIRHTGQKGEPIHKAARSPTRYTQKSGKRHLRKKREVNFCAQPLQKRGGIQSFNNHTFSDTNGRETCTHGLSTKGEKFSLLTFTHLVIPTAGPPITSLGVIRGPITIPRGTTTRRRTFDRATGLSRTGTNTGCTLMRRRWRFGDLFR